MRTSLGVFMGDTDQFVAALSVVICYHLGVGS